MPGINRCSAGVVKPMRKKAVAHRPRIADVQRELARPIRAGRTARMVRLLIADSQELIRLGLRAMLAGEPGLSIRGEAGTLAEAVAEARRVRPDLVLLDAHLPDGSGIEACRLLCNAHARIRILIMTEDKSTAASRKALKAGAYGVIYKDSCHAELLRTVRLAVSNEGHLKSASVNRASRALSRDDTRGLPSRVSLLSPQERRILPFIAEGKTNREIALELGLEKVTVKNYIANMFRKLNIARRTQAAVMYLEAQSSRAL